MASDGYAASEHPEVALEGWLDEHGCVNFVARELANLQFELSEHIRNEICAGQFIIPLLGKPMNLEGDLQTAFSGYNSRKNIRDT